MPTDKIAVIADDYTGAGDAGVHFARFGRKIEFLLHLDALSAQFDKCGDIALSSETRFLAPEDASAVVTDLVRRCRAAGYDQIFKKIDSTMRGNPGSEIAAVLEATGHAGALICPAMPKTGRTCINGTIFVDGAPLHLSDIGSDPFHPLSTSSMIDLLRAQTQLPIGCLGLADIEAGDAALKSTISAMLDRGIRLIIADAVTDAHLVALAQQISGGQLLPVGAGGFAEAIAAKLAPTGREIGRGAEVMLKRPIVAVVGSMAEASRRQADHAEKGGRFVTIEIRADASLAEIERSCVERAGDIDCRRPNVLLRAAAAGRGQKMLKENGERVAEKLGFAAASICRLIGCRTVVSTGGSTSMAVACALGIESVDLVDEILPGIVVGACYQGEGGIDWFISKAGGFGDAEVLTEIDNRCVPARHTDKSPVTEPGLTTPNTRQPSRVR